MKDPRYVVGVLGVLGALVGLMVWAILDSRNAERPGRAEFEKWSSKLSWTYSERDPGIVVDVPFRFLRVGRRAGQTHDFLVGELPSHRAALFTLVRRSLARTVGIGVRFAGGRSEVLRCAVIEIPAACPPLLIERDLEYRGSDVKPLESELFNNVFDVHCDDQRFAFTFVDARLMEWLLAAPTSLIAIETLGSRLLVAMQGWDALPCAQIDEPLIACATELLEHVPELVFSSYPPKA